MKTTNKVFLVGMISVLLAFGFVLASCSQVFEGKDDLSGKAIKLTLKSKSYEIEYDGKTYSGDAKKTSTRLLGVKFEDWTWTSGGTGGIYLIGGEVTSFSYTGNGIDIYSTDLKKRSLADGEISLDDIELIIEE